MQQSVPLNGRCRQAPTLDGVSALTFTPDGRDVLAITPPHNALVDLHRDDEGVTQIRCFSATGTSGGCTRIPRLNGVDALATSSDGKQIYLRTGAGVLWLARDPATGALTPGGCVNPAREGDACQAAPPADPYAYGFTYGTYASGGHAIALSPDDRFALHRPQRRAERVRARRGRHAARGRVLRRRADCRATTPPATRPSTTARIPRSTRRTRPPDAAQAGGCTPIDAFEAPRSLALTPDGSTLLRLQLLGRVDPASRRVRRAHRRRLPRRGGRPLWAGPRDGLAGRPRRGARRRAGVRRRRLAGRDLRAGARAGARRRRRRRR